MVVSLYRCIVVSCVRHCTAVFVAAAVESDGAKEARAGNELPARPLRACV